MSTKIPKDGLHIEQYENGNKKSESNWKDGRMDGFRTFWYESGQKMVEENYKNGLQDGFHASWHENGNKKSEGNYKKGRLDGLWTQWGWNGNKAFEMNHKYEDKEEIGHHDVGLNSDDSDWGYYDHDTNFDIDENGNIKR